MKSKLKFLNPLFAALFLAVALVGCKDDDDDKTTTPPPPADPTIYADLGGSTMVDDPANPGTMIEQGYLTLRSVVDSTIFLIAADEDLNGYFNVLLAEVGNNDLSGFAALSASLTNFFAVATGAENFSYNGLDMVDAHRPQTNRRNEYLVNDAAFTNFVNAVVAGAGQNGVPANDPIIERLGTLLETLRSSVVQTTEGISAQTDIYAQLGGNVMVDDPNNPGTKIEQGYLNLRSVVDSTVFVIAADDRLNDEYFSVLLNEVGNNDLSGFAALSLSLTNFFATATGSDNPAYAYNGLNMVDAHNPAVNNRMGNTADNAAFDAFVEDVVEGARLNGVPNNAPVIAEIGALLETLRGDVVQR
ncbi:MAG: hypothetical protein ACPF8V_00495 [Luteibaculum sp.]